MSHELEIVVGPDGAPVAKMAYTGEEPWHGLGVKVPPDLSPEQILKAAGLDWEVHSVPAWIQVGSGKSAKRIALGDNGLVRSSDNKVLDTVSPDWKTTQNAVAFDFFHEYCMAGDMSMETAGSLHGGRIVWALARVKDSFTILKKDRVDSFLLFVNPHQWARSIEIRFTPVRVVCNNTMCQSLNQKSVNSVRVSHRQEFDPQKVKELLGIAKMQMEGYRDRALFLASKRYTKENLEHFFDEVFPVYRVKKDKEPTKKTSSSARLAMAVMSTQPGAELGEGSWWQAFNAVTFTIDHLIGRTDDSRMRSAWFGTGQQRKIQALNHAVHYAEAA